MTVNRGLALFLTVVAAGALVNASAPPGPPSTVSLRAISARVNAKGASLVIEASEPVAYTTSRPDPLTVLLDFRNVAGNAVANSVAADVKSPIARVSVEAAESLGAPTSRVRIALSQPVAHHVRSDRNSVIVDFDRPSAKAAPYVLPPASRTNGAGAAPDAMLALKEPPAPDPIAALGLDGGVGGPSASSTSIIPAPPMPQPAVIQGASAVAARLAAVQQPPSPPPTQSIDQPNTGSRGRQFTGHPISLDFQGADLRAVLRTFAEISGLNMVIDPAVQGTVDVALRDVPWDQALDIILRANKLGYVVDGTIVRIAPNAVLAEEKTSARQLLDRSKRCRASSARCSGTLSYAKGEEVAALLKSANVALSARTGPVDPRTNTLIISDLPSQFPRDHRRSSTLDRAAAAGRDRSAHRPDQQDLARALGVQWGFNGRVDPALGNTTNLAFPNNGSLGGRTGGAQGLRPARPRGQPTAVNLGGGRRDQRASASRSARSTARSTSTSRCPRSRTRGNGRILSTPRVTTQNNVAAEIDAGRADPDSDRRQQHRHGELQGRGADAEGHAADHRRPTPSSCRSSRRERDARLQPSGQRHPADQHPARQHARCW